MKKPVTELEQGEMAHLPNTGSEGHSEVPYKIRSVSTDGWGNARIMYHTVMWGEPAVVNRIVPETDDALVVE